MLKLVLESLLKTKQKDTNENNFQKKLKKICLMICNKTSRLET